MAERGHITGYSSGVDGVFEQRAARRRSAIPAVSAAFPGKGLMGGCRKFTRVRLTFWHEHQRLLEVNLPLLVPCFESVSRYSDNGTARRFGGPVVTILREAAATHTDTYSNTPFQ